MKKQKKLIKLSRAELVPVSQKWAINKSQMCDLKIQQILYLIRKAEHQGTDKSVSTPFVIIKIKVCTSRELTREVVISMIQS